MGVVPGMLLRQRREAVQGLSQTPTVLRGPLSVLRLAPRPGGDLARTHVPTWAITGKQCWRCGVLREWIYRTRVLAHTQIPQRMLLALDSRTVAMKVGTR